MTTQTEHPEQPLPAVNDRPSIQSLVRGDLEVREQIGIERYHTALQPFNGRDASRDLYEELLDAVCYLRQIKTEQAIALAYDLGPDSHISVNTYGIWLRLNGTYFNHALRPEFAEALGHQLLEAARNARQAGTR